MTSFNDKEKAAENKYARDKEVEFLIHARRDKLFGLWVAEKLGLSGGELDAYAKSVVAEDWNKSGDDYIVVKVRTDLAAKGVHISEHDVRAALFEAGQKAQVQVKG